MEQWRSMRAKGNIRWNNDRNKENNGWNNENNGDKAQINWEHYMEQ